VDRHEGKINGIDTIVYDTPGFCDNDDERINERYIQLILQEVRKLSCMLLIARFDETRLYGDEQRIIKILARTLNRAVWKRTVIVLTFANNVPDPNEYARHFVARSNSIKQEIGEHVRDAEMVDSIPVVAIDNRRERTPDARKWLGELYIAVVQCLSGLTALTLLSATSSRIAINSPRQETRFEAILDPGPGMAANAPVLYNFVNHIEFNDMQREKLRRVVDVRLVSVLGIAGGTIGAIFGPIGSAVGGAVGATAGVIVWLWTRQAEASGREAETVPGTVNQRGVTEQGYP
jgi:hypothetical protein